MLQLDMVSQDRDGQWSQIAAPFQSSDTVFVAKQARDNGWIFDRSDSSIYHFNGVSWKFSQFLMNARYEAATFVGDEGWAVGFTFYGAPLIIHEVNGTWVPVSLK
jgi:hypothetical protein